MMLNFIEKLKKYPYTYLFASIVILFMVIPLFGGKHNLFVAFLFLIVMLSTVFALKLKRKTLTLCLALGLISFGLTALNSKANMAEYTFAIALITYLSYIAFFSICISIFLRKIFYADSASWDSIRGGISVYFLMGIFWAFVYRLVLLLDPGAISFSNPDYAASDIIYFSFTTLTTLGYGDNLPLSPYAKNLTILESTLGQFFLTVLVARLVGMHLASQQSS